MKIGVYFALIVFAILLASPVFAISTNMRDLYQPKETMIVEISGSILEPIYPSNVEFKRGHVLVPVDFDLKKLGDKYYLWAITPQILANYTLFIKNIATYVSGNVQYVTYEETFSVSGNLIDYFVKPGFASTDRDFEIEATLNEDNNKVIETNFLGEDNFILSPGENTIEFSISGINASGLYNATIGKYNLPVYVIANITPTNVSGAANVTNATTNITTNATTNATTNMTNITETANITEISNITNATAIVNLTKILNLTKISDIENLSKEKKEELSKTTEKYKCIELFSGGKVCQEKEKCTGANVTSLEGVCCVSGKCESIVKEEEGGGAWIGYLIAGVILIIIVFVWIRYKKVKAEASPVAKKALFSEKKVP